MTSANYKVSMNVLQHGQVQLGQTAVSSKILATTTAVYNKIKAYNNLTSIKISLKISKLSKLCQNCTYDGHIWENFLINLQHKARWGNFWKN